MTQPGTAVTKKATPEQKPLERLLALAKTPEERERAYATIERYEQQRLLQEISNQVLSESWGNRVSPALRVQLVRFCLDIGADPMRHLEVLGGKPYLNAAYYMELTASAPDFVRMEERWAHETPELTDEEKEARRVLRGQFGIPLSIPATTGLFRDQRAAAEKKEPITVRAACIVSLFFRDRGPFHGVKWSPSRAADDVGMDYPEQAARSRAWRKAGLQAFSPWFKAHPAMERIEELVTQGRTFDVKEEPPAAIAAPSAEAEPTAPPAATAATEQDGAPADAPANHTPSGICGREGPHPLSECGYEKKK